MRRSTSWRSSFWRRMPAALDMTCAARSSALGRTVGSSPWRPASSRSASVHRELAMSRLPSVETATPSTGAGPGSRRERPLSDAPSDGRDHSLGAVPAQASPPGRPARGDLRGKATPRRRQLAPVTRRAAEIPRKLEPRLLEERGTHGPPGRRPPALLARRSGRVARHRRSLPAPELAPERHPARGDPGRARRGPRGDVLRDAGELPAGPRHLRGRRRLPGPDLHHHARLRTRRVLQVAPGERDGGLRHRRPHPHALRAVGQGPRHPPRHVRPPGPARVRRHRDAHRHGVPAPSAPSTGSSTASTGTPPCCSWSARCGS